MGIVRAARGRRGLFVLALALTGAIMTAAPALAALGSGSYRGKTSQGQPVTLSVGSIRAGHGHLVGLKRFTIVWYARCHGSSKASGPLTTYHFRVPLRTTGWSTYGSYTTSSKTGYVGRFTVRDRGSFSGATVRGSFTARVRVLKGTKFVTSCQSGTITFKLSRAGS